jgi:succinyl-diaminopimelate desuccinylase
MQKEIAQLTRQLVAFPSTIDKPEKKRAVLYYAEQWLKRNGIDNRILNHPDSPSLLTQVKGNIKKTILILAHLDVVPASEIMFQAKQSGNILRGRGVIDDKGPAAIMMLLLNELKDELNKPTVKLLITTDEEVGGPEGAKRLAKKGVVGKIDALFVPDGGDAGTIVYKEKGMIHLTLEATGKTAHGSQPWEGENAIVKLWEAYHAIQKIFDGADTKSKNHWHPTVTIGTLNGGDAINKVPDFATMGLDIRFTEKYSLDGIKTKINQAIKGKAKIIDSKEGELLASPPEDSIIKHYKKVMEEELKCKITLGGEHGASDARYFSKFNIPIWLHNPKGGGGHSDEEWIDIDSSALFLKGLKKFLTELKQD